MNVMLYQLVGYVCDCDPSMSRRSEQVVPNLAVQPPIGISTNHFWSDHTCVVVQQCYMLVARSLSPSYSGMTCCADVIADV